MVLVGNSLVFFKDPKSQTPSSWVRVLRFFSDSIFIIFATKILSHYFWINTLLGLLGLLKPEARKQSPREQRGFKGRTAKLGQ